MINRNPKSILMAIREPVEDAAVDSGCHTGFGDHWCFILGNDQITVGKMTE